MGAEIVVDGADDLGAIVEKICGWLRAKEFMGGTAVPPLPPHAPAVPQ